LGFPIPTADSTPEDITPGPDGALWFTESAADQIGRVTTSGKFTEYPIPTAGAAPSGITSGPDGALWFTEFSGLKIGRITTEGQLSEFSVANDGEIADIAAGPDGALWFTGNDAIWRMTTGGEVTGVYPTTGETYGITAGPDGALWFTEPFSQRIGRIATDGQVTEYLTPTQGDRPLLITSAPDGALWYSEDRADRIGRATTAGILTEYSYSNGFGSGGITAGPDGAIWFLGAGVAKVGRAPACGLGFSAAFAGSTLTMNFNLGIDTPATFDIRLHSSSGTSQPSSRPIAAVVPPKAFSMTWKNFPDLGEVTVEPILTNSTGQPYCAETQAVDTAQ
jgi:virginiamycin B lyase